MLVQSFFCNLLPVTACHLMTEVRANAGSHSCRPGAGTIVTGNNTYCLPQPNSLPSTCIHVSIFLNLFSCVYAFLVLSSVWFHRVVLLLVHHNWTYHRTGRTSKQQPCCKVTQVCDAGYPCQICLLSRISLFLTFA